MIDHARILNEATKEGLRRVIIRAVLDGLGPEELAIEIRDRWGEWAEPVAVKARPVVLHQRAIKTGTAALRKSVQERVTPHLRRTVQAVLDRQRADVVARVIRHYEQIKSKPGDTTVWWTSRQWDDAMMSALRPGLTGVAQVVEEHLRKQLGG